jgi:hypothetical protein
MLDRGHVDPRQPPAVRAQPGAELVFLERVEVAVGEMPDALHRGDAVQSAAIEPVDIARHRAPFHAIVARAQFEFDAVGVDLAHAASDRSVAGVRLEERDARFEEAGVEDHVAIEQVEIVDARGFGRGLECELCPRAAGPLGRVGKLRDPRAGIGLRQCYRGIRRSAVGEHDQTAADAVQRRARAADRGIDMRRLVQRLDPDCDRHSAPVSPRER